MAQLATKPTGALADDWIYWSRDPRCHKEPLEPMEILVGLGPTGSGITGATGPCPSLELMEQRVPPAHRPRQPKDPKGRLAQFGPVRNWCSRTGGPEALKVLLARPAQQAQLARTRFNWINGINWFDGAESDRLERLG